MKKKAKNTHIHLLLIAAIGALVLLISGFYMIETRQMKDLAISALTDFAQTPWKEELVTSPGINYFEQNDVRDQAALPIEKGIWDFYEKRKAAIEWEEIYHFKQGQMNAYFFVRNASWAISDEEGSGILIIYSDVSFTSSVVDRAMHVMLFMFGVVMLVLLFVSHKVIALTEQKDTQIRMFFQNVSHELKTPLMSISGYVEGLRTGVTEKEKSYLVIEEEIARMSGLISAILELSKIDSEIVTIHPVKTDLRELLYEVLTSVEPLLTKKQIEVQVDMPNPIFCTCDETMMQSVFANIISNSIRYTQNLVCVKYDGEKFLISNDGKTISEKDREHIFERFYKGENGQTGIGMALTQEYVKLNGGEIHISVIENKTTFIVKL